MAKRKHSAEWMLEKVQEYLNGKGSYLSIARENRIGDTTLKKWVAKYLANGETAFTEHTGNAHYSSIFKTKCVEEVLKGDRTVEETVAKYNISDGSVLRKWIEVYNANRKLEDYDPKREVYMAESRRKTTLEERKEIVEYCIDHDRDYKNTAVKYDVSYDQVYIWVKKHDKSGDDGLKDRRGHHKTDEEVNELDRMRRENLKLKRQLEEKDRLVELLKKVKELERR